MKRLFLLEPHTRPTSHRDEHPSSPFVKKRTFQTRLSIRSPKVSVFGRAVPPILQKEKSARQWRRRSPVRVPVLVWVPICSGNLVPSFAAALIQARCVCVCVLKRCEFSEKVQVGGVKSVVTVALGVLPMVGLGSCIFFCLKFLIHPPSPCCTYDACSARGATVVTGGKKALPIFCLSLSLLRSQPLSGWESWTAPARAGLCLAQKRSTAFLAMAKRWRYTTCKWSERGILSRGRGGKKNGGFREYARITSTVSVVSASVRYGFVLTVIHRAAPCLRLVYSPQRCWCRDAYTRTRQPSPPWITERLWLLVWHGIGKGHQIQQKNERTL